MFLSIHKLALLEQVLVTAMAINMMVIIKSMETILKLKDFFQPKNFAI